MAARPLLPAAALAALVAGCAVHDPATEARYDASLARWKGAPESALLAEWGAPAAQYEQGGSKTLTFVVRGAFGGNQGPQAGAQTLRAGPKSAVVMNGGVTTVPAAPLTCTTRFVLRDGRVESWTFDGVGCGAPP